MHALPARGGQPLPAPLAAAAFGSTFCCAAAGRCAAMRASPPTCPAPTRTGAESPRASASFCAPRLCVGAPLHSPRSPANRTDAGATNHTHTPYTHKQTHKCTHLTSMQMAACGQGTRGLGGRKAQLRRGHAAFLADGAHGSCRWRELPRRGGGWRRARKRAVARTRVGWRRPSWQRRSFAHGNGGCRRGTRRFWLCVHAKRRSSSRPCPHQNPRQRLGRLLREAAPQLPSRGPPAHHQRGCVRHSGLQRRVRPLSPAGQVRREAGNPCV